MRILIAEDEPGAARGLSSLIRQSDPDSEIVGIAYDGREAFDMALELQPDVLMTDIRMPVMGGLELIRAVRARRLPFRIVIISAYEDFEAAREALSLDVDDYLVKPVMREDVEKVLGKLRHEPGAWLEEDFDLKKRYPDAHPLVLKALKIIEDSYATHLRQAEVAESLGVTAEYFSFLFNRDVHMNFSRVLRKYRIEKAKKLLSEPGTDKEEVWRSTGFSDVRYFQRVFKEETGMTVSEFMRTIR